MKNMYVRLLNGFLSLITTLLLIAAPVAAIVYSAEPAAENDQYMEERVSNRVTSQFSMQNDWLDKKIQAVKPDFLDDTLVSTWSGLKSFMETEPHKK